MDEDEIVREVTRPLWAIARGLALVALAITSDDSHRGDDGFAAWNSAKDLLTLAEKESAPK